MCGCRKSKAQAQGLQSPTSGTGLQGLSENDPVVINIEDLEGE